MRIRRSNPLALAILVYLGERPRHPYEIAADMRLRHQHDSIKLNYGSLYSVIAALERQGLIEAQATLRDSRRPERTVYSITPAGRRESSDWLSELLASPTKEYLGFEAALSLIASLPPDEAAGLLRRRLGALDQGNEQLSASLQRRDPALPRLFVLEAEYQLALGRAEREFVASLVADIETGTLDGLAAWRSWSVDLPNPDAG
jgi:DNA-binding PadR family transcriptional regulator